MKPPGFDRSRLEALFFQFSPPTRFGQAYRADIEGAPYVQALLHANVTNIQGSENGAEILHVDLATLEGKHGRVRAKTFVLACGGLENARLLLASNGVEPHGLGNRYDLVGRFFMDHGVTRCAVVQATDAYALLDRFGTVFTPGTGTYRVGLRLGDEFARRERTLNATGMTYYHADPESGVAAARSLAQDLKHASFRSEEHT